MDAKKWLWIVIACLAIVVAYQIVKLTGGNPVEPSSPEAEQAVEPDRKPIQTASLGELTGMLEERKPLAIEPANVEEPEQISAATTEGSEPSPEEPEPDTAEPVETVEEVRVQDPPVIETIPQSRAADALVKFPNKGLVRGIVYSAERGSALIDETIVRTGGTVDGVKIVRIHAGGVDFEKDGHKWTQKVSETPDPLWR
ncbi:MAG: hypothetical protein ACYS0H_02420 [Planctomycetota bacterium]|jgi:hypothetical protein